VSAARRVLLGEEGTPAGLTTRAIVLALGVAAVVVAVVDLSHALRPEPEPLPCAQWLAAPGEAHWVTLTGCHLDLRMAASRRWKGWWLGGSSDAGRHGRMLELFIPISATDQRDWPVRAVVATSDPALLALMDQLVELEVPQVGAFLEQHREELEARLQPATLSGYVEPVPSLASQAALKNIEAEGAVVLQEGLAPPRADAVFMLVVGLTMVVASLWPIASRLRAHLRGELDEEEAD
jgi:hypothetical protein